MALNPKEYDDRIEHLVPWQQYLRAKWTASLFERFKDVKELWHLAEEGSEEEKRRLDERLCDLFYEVVAPAVFKYFGDDIVAETWDDFAAAAFEVSGLDIDKDFLGSSPVMLDIAPAIKEWVKG
ncbi:MAG: hypothetical protein ACYC1U_09845 [Candidatus Aquicultorales bacterium]